MIAEDILIRKVNALPPGKINEVIDFVDFLASLEEAAWRAERTASITAFASEYAGSDFDLDAELEAAGVESLLAIDGSALFGSKA